MKSVILATAFGLGLALAAGSASAAPLTTSGITGGSAQGPIVLAQFKSKHGKGPRRSKYRAGSHHKHAPGGWRRYDKRPGDWSRRGCIVVGPIWYCP